MIKFPRKDLLNSLIESQLNSMVKIITGARRSGKSYLLFELYRDYLIKQQKIKANNIITIDLENPKNKKYENPGLLYDFIISRIKNKKEKYFIFIDEIQAAMNKNKEDEVDWQIKFHNLLNGLLSFKNVDIYVTGSNSRLLSTDVVTEFRGRGETIHVSPLTFSEIYEMNMKKNKIDLFNKYLMFGGMPKIWQIENSTKQEHYLHSLINDTYIIDVIERYNLKNDTIVKFILMYLASVVGNYVSLKNIVNFYKNKKIKINEGSLKSYLSHFKEAFIIQELLRYDTKGKRFLNTISKYYFNDIGIRNAIVSFRNLDYSNVIENIVFNELIKREFKVCVGNVFIFEDRQRKTLEIDFIASKNNKEYYIQVTENIRESKKRDQEKRPLLAAKNGFKKIIITKDEVLKPYYDEDGILIMDIYYFLLNKNSLDEF